MNDLSLFIQRFQELSGEYFAIPAGFTASTFLRRLALAEDLSPLVIGRGAPGDLAEVLTGAAEIIADFSVPDPDPMRNAAQVASRAKAGITGVDAIISETGTLALYSKVSGDRVLSLIPPVHIVLLDGAPIYRSLEEFLADADPRETIQFISGPSRTADIEKMLVLGVHGPLRVIAMGGSPGDA